jgi:hypothetical protein
VLSGTPVTLTAGRNRFRSPRTDPISMVGLRGFARFQRFLCEFACGNPRELTNAF